MRRLEKTMNSNNDVIVSDTEFAELSTEVLGASASIRFRALGSSMSPFIREGDVLTVDPARPENLSRGKVALYRSSNGRLLAHRILAVRQGHFLIRGDASWGACEEVKAERISGIVVAIQRGNRAIQPDAWHRRWAALVWAVMPPFIRRFAARAGRLLLGT